MAFEKQIVATAAELVLKHMHLVVDRAKNSVFAPKTSEGKDAGERQAADEERPMGIGHDSTQAAELAHVDDTAHGVHDAASTEEEEGLEEGVREEVIHSAGDASEGARAESEE